MSEVKRKLFVDETEKRLTFVTVQDVEDIVEHNKVLNTLEQTNTDGLKHIAQIPMNILNQWMNEEWARGNNTMRFGDLEFEIMVAAKLADPDNAVWRTDGVKHRVGYLDS
jgi:hypothetical protein